MIGLHSKAKKRLWNLKWCCQCCLWQKWVFRSSTTRRASKLYHSEYKIAFQKYFTLVLCKWVIYLYQLRVGYSKKVSSLFKRFEKLFGSCHSVLDKWKWTFWIITHYTSADVKRALLCCSIYSVISLLLYSDCLYYRWCNKKPSWKKVCSYVWRGWITG